MSDTWSDECEEPASTDWATMLVAVKIDGFVVFREVPDRGEGFVSSNGFLVYTGTVRSRRRVRKRASDGIITLGS